MPKPTFYNLPKDKKALLVKALVNEFSRVPLYEASISNIVKLAAIPRGSFYQYFVDKDDAYFYVLNELIEANKSNFILLLQESQGDLFVTMNMMFEQTLIEISKGENIDFLKNAFLNMTHKVEASFKRIFNGNGSKEQFEEISLLINKQNLNIDNERELSHLIQIVATITFRNLISMLSQDLTDEEARTSFQTEMKLLKNGLYRKEKR